METRKYSDRRDYLITAVKKRRKAVRNKAIATLGGKCSVCGYDTCIEALEFHHLDQNLKEFSISQNGHSRSWERVEREIQKCILLCANCHREEHSKTSL